MLSKKLFVFPTSRSIRDHISKEKQTNQFLNKSITIGDFFSKLITPKNNQTFIDNDLRILILQEAIGNLDISKLGIEKGFTKLFSSSEYLFKFFQEMSHEKISIETINTFDTYEFYQEHLLLLQEIYLNYTQTLKKYNYVDSITIVDEYTINSSYIEYFEEITLFYEGYFSKFEFELIEKIAKNHKLLIHLKTNRFNTKNQKLFTQIGFDIEDRYSYILDMNNKKIIDKKQNTNKAINHIIYPVNQRLDQIGMIKKSITDMVNDGIDPAKIAIILPDEKFYSFLKIFDNEKYFNFAMGNDIFESIFYKKIKTIQEYLNNEEPKYKIKVDFNQLEQDIIDKQIKSNWKKPLTKDLFFDIFDTIFDAEENGELKEKLLELRVSLEKLLFTKLLTTETIRLQDGFKILLQKLSQITLDDVRSGKVTVLGILETRYAQFDGVIVIDFNDHLIPKRSIKDKFISSKIKEQVGLPSALDRQNLQKYYYQRLMESAKKVAISYTDNEENSMSRFINELFDKPNIQRRDFTQILLQASFIQTNENDIILDIDLSKRKWSASALKTYLSCKRRFYLNYILKIKEHDISIEPKSYEVGSIIHSILQKVIESNPLEYTYDDIINQLQNHQNKNPYMIFELELWKKPLQKFYQIDKNLKKEAIPIYFEKYFETKYNDIILHGTIDRIDKTPNGQHIIYDYKTSKNLKVDTKKNYLDATDFQLEFYYLLAREFDVNKVAYFDLYNSKIKSEEMFEEKLKLLENYLKSLKTTQVNFKKCDDKTICQWCPYKTICNR